MTELRFFKYEALGNDFIVIDEMHLSVKKPRQREPSLSLQERMELCDRHRGIGADGIITVFRSEAPETFAYMHITNLDGSVPEMCGNGFRCAVKWLADEGKIPGNVEGALLTDDGVKSFKLEGDICTVNMGLTDFKHATASGAIGDVTFLLPKELGLNQIQVWGTAVSIGNPHLVLDMQVSDLEAERIGAFLECHSSFPNRTNVEFATVISPTEVALKIWERGVGLTKACGTGACASVAVLVNAGKLKANQEIRVFLTGGELYVTAKTLKLSTTNREKQLQMVMRGSARRVFSGFFRELGIKK
jgi:diaminopimelate epimerase